MRRYLLPGLTAGLVVAGVLGLARRDAGPLQDLKRTRPLRTFTARLSIPTEYRLCAPVRAEDDGTVPREACGGADDALLDPQEFAAGGEGAEPDSLEAAALASLIGGERTEASLDTVIAKLLKAYRLSADPVPLLVDLSGAHLVRAQQTRSSRDLVQGLSYAIEALSHEPRNRAALFNAALALESLAIDGQAVKAWDAYLATDSRSSWAKEARERKRALLRPRLAPREPGPGTSAEAVNAFAARHPQEARLLGWDRALGAWGDAVLKGDTARAALHLDLAEKLGHALERRRGDASLADAVRAIRKAASDPADTHTLALAHRAYAAGQERYQAREITAARDSFTRVIGLRPSSSMLVAWTTAFRGAMQVYGDTVAAEEAFRTLLSRVDSVRYPALTARVRWMRGTLLIRNGHHSEAWSHYHAAAQTFRRIGETEFLGAVLGNLGETSYKQGDTIAGYRLIHRALRILRSSPDSIWLHNTLFNLAHFATLDGMAWAAAPIEEEDMAVSRHIPESLSLEALLGRARVRALAGQVDAAAGDVEAATPLVDGLEAGVARDQMTARLQFLRTVVGRGKSPLRSTVALDSAIGAFAENVAWLIPALLLRADVRLAGRDVVGGTADLDAATKRIWGMSGQEVEARLRAAMIEEARSRFDQLVMLHASAGKPREALQALERGRVSFIPGHEAPSAAARSDPVSPPGEVAVEYALIGDTLLTWTVRGGSVHPFRRTLDRSEFLRTVERVGAALESPSPAPAVSSDLARLYDWLVRPVQDNLGATETPLVILADGEVASVPFEALLDARRNRYLIEDHPLRFAASLDDARRAPGAAAAAGPALLVADPAFDARQYPTLDRLRWARAEVASLQPLYPGAPALAGSAATRAAFIARARRASLIHYAGHALFDDTRPERSFLVLAGDGTSGQLTTAAVDSLNLSGVRLVVLSACRTLRSREGRSGGFAGLSGALLAAGAGGVVGSLWDVNDRRAQPLMLAFHREYLRSRDPARALRKAQLQMLRSHDPKQSSPAAWAGFRYAGAAASIPGGTR
ncbi:MAG: CHAT domain-containing protein [Longimicrobiaceae bacterium]